jgi:DNA repair photolyase
LLAPRLHHICSTGARGSEVSPVGRLRRELAGIETQATIGVGTLCDAHATFESRNGVTRAALEELITLERRLFIVTQGSTILRDSELLASYPLASVTV